MSRVGAHVVKSPRSASTATVYITPPRSESRAPTPSLAGTFAYATAVRVRYEIAGAVDAISSGEFSSAV